MLSQPTIEGRLNDRLVFVVSRRGTPPDVRPGVAVAKIQATVVARRFSDGKHASLAGRPPPNQDQQFMRVRTVAPAAQGRTIGPASHAHVTEASTPVSPPAVLAEAEHTKTHDVIARCVRRARRLGGGNQAGGRCLEPELAPPAPASLRPTRSFSCQIANADSVLVLEGGRGDEQADL